MSNRKKRDPDYDAMWDELYKGSYLLRVTTVKMRNEVISSLHDFGYNIQLKLNGRDTVKYNSDVDMNLVFCSALTSEDNERTIFIFNAPDALIYAYDYYNERRPLCNLRDIKATFDRNRKIDFEYERSLAALYA